VYRFGREEIAAAIRARLDARNGVVNRPADAGLAMLEANGDFADGVIAWEGRWLGGEMFVSFDRQVMGW
jgi:predicted nucleic-acid-binding protein